ncbi:MAG TPA: hypothetical protein DCS93_18390 [Microscillaceae bacterium]|nr:hypothetical protein [Microscillaceae bacterium]
MDRNTILIVDDDKEGLKTLNYYFEESPQKYQVLSASNGTTALKVLRKKIPELIITDWDMPEMNGLELIQHIKGNQATAHLPVIIITGINTSPQNLKKAFDIGADDFLTKPLNQIELFARTNATLKMYRAFHTIKKQREVIEDQKNRELNSKTIEVVQKRQLLSNIQKRVNKVGYKVRGELKAEMRDIEKEIHNSLSFENEWKTFKVHFENVHPHFFDDLLKKCATLSQADLRHCAYLKIGLNNNEIAHIFGISASSVITQHYRIKKKLGIKGKQRLASFVRHVA